MIAGNHAEFIQLYNDFKDSKTWQELQFSNADFASRISPRALDRWKSGEGPIPLTAIFLLRLLVKQEKEARRELA
jgi:hypothetical protein